jgi:ankyrin repeat protein
MWYKLIASIQKGNVIEAKSLISKITKLNKQQLNQQDNFGNTALHIAVKTKNMEEVSKSLILEMTFEDILLKNTVYDNAETALHLAAFSGQLEVCKLITEKAPEAIFSINKNGMTALHLAAFSGQLEVCKLIIEKNPETLCVVDIMESIPLDWAKLHGKLEVCELLMSAMTDDSAIGNIKEAELYASYYDDYYISSMGSAADSSEQNLKE